MEGLHHIHLAWTGWLKNPPETLSAQPDKTLCDLWRGDGIRALSWRQTRNQLQLVVTVSAPVCPAFVAQRIKGRWQHHMRSHPGFEGFTKNFFLRTLGPNNRDEVDAYIRNQAQSGDFADPLCRKHYHDLRYIRNDGLDPISGLRMQYDLFYHLVLVMGERVRMRSEMEPRQLSDKLPTALDTLGLILFDLSIMPDHMHLLLRGEPGGSSEDLLQAVREASGTVLGRSAFWQAGGYVGSVGPYRLQTVMLRNEGL